MNLRKRTRRLLASAVLLAVFAVGVTASVWNLGSDDVGCFPEFDAPGSVVINAEVLNYANPMETPTLALQQSESIRYDRKKSS